MKNILLVFILGVCLMLTACNSKVGNEVRDEVVDVKDDIKQGIKDVVDDDFKYINEKYNYVLEVPDDIYNNCDITSSDDGKYVNFNLRTSNDNVFSIITVEDANFKNDMHNAKFLGSNEGYTTFIQFPDTTQISNENMRPLWEEMIEEAHDIEIEDFYFNNK